MKTCIIYLRISREKDGEKELSIESQRDQCERKAKSLEANVEKVFVDRDKSARTNKRPEFQEALRYCEATDIDYFIVWSTSRFSRNILNAKNDKLRLERAGTSVKYVTTEIEDSDAGFLHLSILELFDEFSSRQIGSDTRRSMVKNAIDGYWNGGRVPFGFLVIEDIHNRKKKKLTVLPEEAAIVKRMFKLRLKGLGSKAIADVFNKEGLLIKGDRWTIKKVCALLRNKKVIGITSFGKKNHEGVLQPKEKWIEIKSHEEIIDRDLWNKVQEMMDRSTDAIEYGSHKSTWAFTGLLKCGHCDRNMVVKSGKGRSKRYYYYTCPSSKNGRGCKTKSLSAEKIDAWLINQLCQLILSPRNLINITDEFNKTATNWDYEKGQVKRKCKRELLALESRNNKLFDMLETSDGDLNIADIAPRIKSNNKKITTLKVQLQKIESYHQPATTDMKPEELALFLEEKILKESDPKSKRNFIRSFVQTLVLKDKHLDIKYVPSALISSDVAMVPCDAKWCPDGRLQGTKNIRIRIPERLPALAA